MVAAVMALSTWVWPQVKAGGSGGTTSVALVTAKKQLVRGQLQEAETSLWGVLSSDPNNEEALRMLGAVRVKQNRFPEAEALFRRVVQINAKSAAGLRDLGEALAIQNKIPEAIDQYKKAEELAPHDTDVKVELARLYVSTGQFQPALATLDDVPAARFPLEALPVKAAALIAVGKREAASSLIDRAKGSAVVEGEIAEVFLEGRLPDEALRALALIPSGNARQSARYLYLKGRALAAKGQSEAARSTLRQAVAADPKSADALVALAELYANENQHSDAMAALEKARAIHPDSLPVLRHLVVEATKAGDSKMSVNAASDLADKSPDNAGDLYLAGAAMLQQNVQGASSVLEKYVALRSDNAKAWMGLGMAYVQQERYVQARKPLERAIELDPTLAEAHYELGVVAKNEANAGEAIDHLQKAVQLEPRHASAYRTLGSLYLQGGDLEKSRDALEHAEAIDPNNLQTQYDLGLVLNKLGRTELARQHMEQYRKLKEAQGPGERRD
jgi:tetratricopeptide (TPR) repeat protein